MDDDDDEDVTGKREGSVPDLLLPLIAFIEVKVGIITGAS